MSARVAAKPTSSSARRAAPRDAAADTTPLPRRRPRPLATLLGLVIVVSAVGLLSVLLFPWQSLTSQRRNIDHATDTLQRLRAETSHLEIQVAEAKDPVVVERIAREQLSLVREGDVLYRLSVDPADVMTLPPAWPLPGVAHLLGDDER